MTVRELAAGEVGLPVFSFQVAERADAFDLSSHRRAREALELALDLPGADFNIFVVGQSRSGRLSATVDYLRAYMAGRSAPDDWLYLANFKRQHRPRPLRLPAGRGRDLRDQVNEFLRTLQRALPDAFEDERYQRRVQALQQDLRASVDAEIEALQARAQKAGLALVQGEQGLGIVEQGMSPEEAAGKPFSSPEKTAEAQKIGEALQDLGQRTGQRQSELALRVQALDRQVAEAALTPLLRPLRTAFAPHAAVQRWLEELAADLIEILPGIRALFAQQAAAAQGALEARYTVNLLVDHGDVAVPEVVVEPEPTYERLFGWVEYVQSQGGLTTAHRDIRAGAMHRANGGVLVLRAEAVAARPEVWEALKGALRDRQLRIVERHRTGSVPTAGAPQPKPIPFEAKVVLVGSPQWYYSFFAVDPDFTNYFKIKADIDREMPANADNLAGYAALLRDTALESGQPLEESGIGFLMALAAREAGRRDRLSARFELHDDLIAEAAAHRRRSGATAPLDRAALADAWERRLRRNARIEDYMQADIGRGAVMIATRGAAVGQINGLTVRDLGDHVFGSPTRITARASVGRRGLVNIERDVELGGPIQQKGVMVLQGFLAGRFARHQPLSFNCSVTFEQSYAGVEGDSASLAELLAVLSDLAGIPLRQDVGVTGSVNQVGEIQPVGGVTHKVEGFYRSCVETGGLSGTQGVLVPAVNAVDLVLSDEVAEAVAAGRFHLWSAERVESALELLTGLAAGSPDDNGDYPPDSVYGRVMAELAHFDDLLAERGARPSSAKR